MNRIDNFIEEFRNHKEISLKEIFDYFYSQDMTNDKSITALLSRWTKQGILFRVKRGGYVLTNERKKLFKLSADKTEKRLAKIFETKYPELKYVVWHTDCLNRLMIHQHFSPFYIFETESEILESVFYLFKDNKLNVFMGGNEDDLQMYMYNTDNPIILRKLISRSPLVKKEKVSHPEIEKILVDIFIDRKLFNFIQDSELDHIYNAVFEDYVVNISKLLNYADRRKAKVNIQNYIRQTIHNPDVIALL